MVASIVMLASAWVAVGVTPAFAVGAPWTAGESKVFVSQSTNQDPTGLYQATQVNGQLEFGVPVYGDFRYNALAFREADGYLYARDLDSGSLLKIGNDGIPESLGPIEGQSSLSHSGAFGQGEFADSYFIKGGDDMQVVDINSMTSTPFPLIGAAPNAADITAAFGYFWGWSNTGDTITRIDPATGVTTPFAIDFGAPTGSYGAAWTYGNGNMAFSHNNTGTVYQVSVENPASASPTFTLISELAGPAAGSNDGTAIAGAPTDLGIVKTATASVGIGETITWNVSVTNNGPATSSGFVITDAVPAGVTGVTAQGATISDGSCAVAAGTVKCNGDVLQNGESADFVFTGVAPMTAGTVVNTASVFGNEADTDPSNDESTASTIITAIPHLAVTKSSDAGGAALPGEVIAYTVAVTNDGTADYTTANPAALTDNLSDVLDDATWNNTAAVTFSNGSTSAAPTLSGNTLNWSGPLKKGETATITYSVTVTNAGNHSIVNNACVPNAGEDPSCATTDTQLPNLAKSKSVDPSSGTAVTGGQALTYTLTYANSGLAPAAVDDVDTLAGLLDDADITVAPTSSDPSLTVSGISDGAFAVQGTVAAGATVTVTYQATVKPDSTRTGDNSIVNWLLPSGTEPPADCEAPLCTINPVPDVASSKSVDVGTGTTVTAGEVLTYTLNFTNTGTAPGAVNREDILTHVLDDATLTSGPTASDPALTAALTDERIAVTGTLQPNQTVTVSYQVTIKPDGERGDNQIANFLLEPGAPVPPPVCDGSTGDCTYNPIPNVGESKTVNPASGTTVNVGEVLTYTLTFTNDGKAAGPVDKADVLTDVLDDATLTSGPTTSDPALTAELTGDRLEIAGTLAAGQTVTVTYAVTVKTDAARGNDSIANFLLDPRQDPPATCDPSSGLCTVNPIPRIVDSKSVDPASETTVLPGDVLTYTLTFENIGTGAGAVAKDDVLTQVLDDAALTGTPVSSDPAALTPTLEDDRISVTGNLAAGQSVTVTYQVTVLPDGERGNDLISNFLVAPGAQPPLVCLGDDCTVNRIPHIVDSKGVDPASGTTVLPGDVLTYTLTFENIGTGAGVVAKDDVLTEVLDDATLTSAPVSSNPALTATLVGDRLSVTGTLAAGQSVTVTYAVTVLPDADRGNDLLSNFLVAPGTQPPAECEGDDCTVNLVPRLVDSKSVDPESGSTVLPGDVLTYTLTFQNIGTGPGALAKEDALADVLDDATLTDGPTTSDPALAASVDGDRILVTGTLAADQTVTVTYTVTVLPDAERGNDLLSNFLVDPGAEPPAECEGDDCTVNLIPHIVDEKSVNPASGTAVVTGDTVEYTLTFENIGSGTGSFAKEDVLTDVLDDATLVDAPVSSDPAVTAVLTDDRIQVAGTLEAAQVVTVTYSVIVNDDTMRGNSSLANYLIVPGSEPPAACEGDDCTVNPMPRIEDTKSVDPASGTTVIAGDTLSYTLTFSNTGTAPGDVARDDSLVDVLDDADISVAPVSSDPALQPVLDGDVIHVTGNLAVGQTVTVTYAVTVRPDGERGDNVLGNFIVMPGAEPPADCEIGNVDCTANPVPLITGSKSVDPASGSNVVTGQVLTYTLGFVNSGAATGDVDYTDVLTDVLDDAVFVDGSLIVSDPTLTAAFDGSGIHIVGPLAVDQAVTISYQVTVLPAAERANGLLGNFLVKAGETPPEVCEVGSADCTLNPIPHLSVLKTSDATPTIKVGDTLVYEVTVTNDGTGDFTEENPATVTDDLSSVLDDATYNGDATATATDGSEPVVAYEEPLLSWTGPLASGDSVVITYTVTTTGAGDLIVVNGACVPNAGEDDSCAETTTGLADVDIVKSVDPASGTILAPGDTANYTLTITNHGTGTGAFSYTDYLADVLDDATIAASPVASLATVTVTPIAADQFTAKGLLEADETVTVSYSVTTKVWEAQGNHTLGNWVTETGEEPTGVCEPDDGTCTTNPIQPHLAHTGVDGTGLLVGTAGFLLLGGLCLMIVRRRRFSGTA